MAQSLEYILTDVEVSFWDLTQWLEEKIQRSGLDSLGDVARSLYLADRYDAGMAQGGYGTLLVWNPELDIMWMIPALETIGPKKLHRRSEIGRPYFQVAQSLWVVTSA